MRMMTMASQSRRAHSGSFSFASDGVDHSTLTSRGGNGTFLWVYGDRKYSLPIPSLAIKIDHINYYSGPPPPRISWPPGFTLKGTLPPWPKIT
jgi:hypothetical protein